MGNTVENPSSATRIGIDIGGTFTDVAAIGPDGLHIGKVLTTPHNESEGVLDAVDESGVPLGDVKTLVHGTTLVINSLLERDGAVTGLVTTAGFADVVEMGRGNRPQGYNVFFRRDPVLVPRERRFEINERVAADGEILRKPTSKEIDIVAGQLRRASVQSVAIAFLNSYLEPSNEIYVANELARRIPDLYISVSSDVSKEWREYERFTTAVANAFAGLKVRDYISLLETRFMERLFEGEFALLDSNGGALHPQLAARLPVRLVESGPVGGVIGASSLAARLGLADVVTFDMGGTTAKSSLVENGSYQTRDLYWVGGYDTGFPLQTPSVDILEIGAGGGSIAWVDDGGRLRVGPKSAGAAPGPACYGAGGSEPTVTDANVFLNRMPAEYFVAGISIDRQLAIEAISRLAGRLDMDPFRLALGIVMLADLSMSEMVRRQTAARGRNPQEFTLVAFGGAGPLHAYSVAREVGIGHVLIPPCPGHFSAIGMLAANLRFDRREVFQRELKDLDTEELASRLTSIVCELRNEIAREPDDSRYETVSSYSLAMRYVGQSYTVTIAHDGPGIEVSPNAVEKFAKAFESEYLLRFGHVDSGAPVEIVEVTVVVERQFPTAHAVTPLATTDGSHPPVIGQVEAIVDPSGATAAASVYDRSKLRVGDRLVGPALIFEPGTITLLPELARAVVLAGGEISIEVQPLPRVDTTAVVSSHGISREDGR